MVCSNIRPVFSDENQSLKTVAYFKETVATLEISGTSHSGPIQSWIETFVPLQVIVAYRKDATLPVLEALHKVRNEELTPVVRSSRLSTSMTPPL